MKVKVILLVLLFSMTLLPQSFAVVVSNAESTTATAQKLTFKQKMAMKLFKSKAKKANKENDKVMNGFAVAGFVCAVVGVFVAGFLLGTLGVVFSAIAMNKIKKNPEKFKGKGMAIAGLVIGIVAVVGAAIVLGMG